jgi:Flp pilus assembly protein TadD
MTIMIHCGRRVGDWCIVCCLVALSTAAQHNPATPAQDAAALLQQGQSLASAGRLAEAEVPLTAAASLAPHDIQLLTLLAEVKSRLGEQAEAVQLFRQVAAVQPRSSTAHLNLAIALADTSDAQSALVEVEKAIRLDPRNARAHLNRARLLADTGRSSDARAEFLRASQLDPNNVEVDLFRGIFEKENHRPQVAAPLLRKVVEKQPGNARAYFLLGQTLAAAGKQEDAIAAWQHALTLDPASEETVYALSQALRVKDPAAATQMLEKFKQLRVEKGQTDRARELGNQAYAAMQQQAWPEAIASLQQAIKICQHCVLEAALHQRLGLAECHNGDLDTGERELRTSLALDPNDELTLKALNWVTARRNKQPNGP